MTGEKQVNRTTDLKDEALETPRASVEAEPQGPTHEEIAARAYECWQERGGIGGTAEEDWFQAERELRAHRARSAAASSS